MFMAFGQFGKSSFGKHPKGARFDQPSTQFPPLARASGSAIRIARSAASPLGT